MERCSDFILSAAGKLLEDFKQETDIRFSF